ncbi:Hypothetical protein GLP15_4709 [Giardia lamblia P15]|uniref:Uncharacterized protein n=1 Tax=Giardia intestinalis (strain P15) TaxID=658858 RepID=E1F1P9_GIAIA|nr:Hypothetical protein GLP15_4709 [Giardia lamblia P15]
MDNDGASTQDASEPRGTVFYDFDSYFNKEMILLTVLGISEIKDLGFINAHYDTDTGHLYTDSVAEVFIKEMEASFGMKYSFYNDFSRFNFKTRDMATAEANLAELEEASKQFSHSSLCDLTYSPSSIHCLELSGILRSLQQFLDIFEFPNSGNKFTILVKEGQVEKVKKAIESSKINFGKNTPVVNVLLNKDRAKSAWRFVKFRVCVKYGYIKKLVPQFNKLSPVPILLISPPGHADD